MLGHLPPEAALDRTADGCHTLHTVDRRSGNFKQFLLIISPHNHTEDISYIFQLI